ncbi:unnamed protein product [Nippostrongylus brasiliensis]|uniref:Uncharacterized protein n=1 Tax=Nippostrongylus brasiliensis TaxID=27835 RepID=A0A0N4YBY6_NIPBR|nr:unnamed protein product [Nippostrongylus brasiliensis]
MAIEERKEERGGRKREEDMYVMMIRLASTAEISGAKKCKRLQHLLFFAAACTTTSHDFASTQILCGFRDEIARRRNWKYPEAMWAGQARNWHHIGTE